MIFNEIYSAYYNAVARIIAAVIRGDTDEKRLSEIVSENAFGESMFSILPSLKSGKWQLVNPDMTTQIKNVPTMPLTLLQKRWLKEISLDARIRLFDVEVPSLDDVEPLFTADDYYIYDKYSDGDPYDDENYIRNFREILRAMREKRNIKLELVNRKGRVMFAKCIPERLEYSEKDDKFRLITGGGYFGTVNLAKIIKCRICDGGESFGEERCAQYEEITLRMTTERNTLERALMHFAHFEKRAEKADDHYILHIKFNRDDESELVIRVLSFGPTVEVVGPEGFRKLIIKKLTDQKSCGL